MADSPTVVVVGGGGEPSAPPMPAPQSGEPEAQEHKEAIQLGAILEANRQAGETIQQFNARLDAMEARETERGAQMNRLIASLESAQEPEPDVEEIEPEPEPAPAEPEPEPEVTKQECKPWLKPFLGAK